jgi:hypothetical protein
MVGAGALVLLSATAFATYVRDGSTEEWSGISGPGGAKKSELLAGGEYHSLRSFKFWDYDQRPCAIEVNQVSLNAERVTSLDRIKICEPKIGESWKAVDLGSGRYVSAVQVCTEKPSEAGQRVRGARFWGVALEGDGSLKEKGKPASFELPDCKKWHERKSCPKGKVATGLRAYYDDAARGITSLELRCHGVKQQKEGG